MNSPIPKDLKKIPYINRELSWLKFNERILEEAENEENPLLERLRFLCIYQDNLDEFFMIRVGGLVGQRKQGKVYCSGFCSREISSLLVRIRDEAHKQKEKHEYLLEDLISNQLPLKGIVLKQYRELSFEEKSELKEYYKRSVFPVLTPVVVGASHPFPFLSNLNSYLFVEFEKGCGTLGSSSIGFIQIPSLLESLVEISSTQQGKRVFVLIETMIEEFAEEVFGDRKIKSKTLLRVIRNLDYRFLESNISNLKEVIEKKIITREIQSVVRLELSSNSSPFLVHYIKESLKLKDDVFYFSQFFCASKGLKKLVGLPYPELKFKEFNPRIPSRLVLSEDIFSCIREEDLLVHHPFESFYTIGEFIQTAANDPQTIAIKQTLYRSSGDSPIIQSLIEAVRNGKDVTVVIELMARFDEKNNIDWAKKLEKSGVKVSYGFVALKTHCKLSIVLRREGEKIVKYSHLSTGNYNTETAQLYTDLGLLTSHDGIGDEVLRIFNMITSLNINSLKADPFRFLIAAPHDMRKKVISLIREVKKSNSRGVPCFIIIKVNSLVDPIVIRELYSASNSGVKIHLIVRGACCLRPGLEGYSKNIIVTSIIDRFLEHSRIFILGLEERNTCI